MAKKDIEKHQFKKGETGNKNGRPKKFVNQVLADLEKEGAHQVTKQMVQSVYEMMLSLTRPQLAKIGQDESKPMLYRIVARGMLSKKAFQVIEQMIDRAQGKPIQTQNVNQVTELLSDGLNIIIPDPDDKIKEQFDKNSFDDD